MSMLSGMNDVELSYQNNAALACIHHSNPTLLETVWSDLMRLEVSDKFWLLWSLRYTT